MAGLLTQFFLNKVAEEKEKIMEDFSSDEERKDNGNDSDGSANSNSSYIIMHRQKEINSSLQLKI